VLVPETGIIMNNGMNDFSIPNASNAFGYRPSPSNYIRPHKRPLSSMTPTLITHANGTLILALGAGGGSHIITATVQAIWAVLDRGLGLAAALAAPRLHDQLIPNVVSFESAGPRTDRYADGTVRFMQRLGHAVEWVPAELSAVQAVMRLANGTFEAAGEPRQEGSGGFAV
jgi:gamma-glutamyltranspeptidase/glutathione hydrolase